MNLDLWFSAQDRVMARNRSEIEDEYRWLNAAVGLLSDVQEFVNTNPNVQTVRKAQGAAKHQASNVVVNLVNDAMGGIVNASRLLLFGRQWRQPLSVRSRHGSRRSLYSSL